MILTHICIVIKQNKIIIFRTNTKPVCKSQHILHGNTRIAYWRHMVSQILITTGMENEWLVITFHETSIAVNVESSPKHSDVFMCEPSYIKHSNAYRGHTFKTARFRGANVIKRFTFLFFTEWSQLIGIISMYLL